MCGTVESGLEQHITGVMQCIDAIQVRGHPEREVFAGTYSGGLAKLEVGFETNFLLSHQWDRKDGKDNENNRFHGLERITRIGTDCTD